MLKPLLISLWLAFMAGVSIAATNTLGLVTNAPSPLLSISNNNIGVSISTNTSKFSPRWAETRVTNIEIRVSTLETNLILEAGLRVKGDLDGTNYTLAVALAGTNYANSVALGSTNYTYTVLTNEAALRVAGDLAGTNYANSVASGSTNYTYTAITNEATLRVAGDLAGTNYANTVAQNSTNYTDSVGASVALAGTNYANNVALGFTNYIAIVSSNVAVSATNYTDSATNALWASTTNLVNNASTNEAALRVAGDLAGTNYANSVAQNSSNYTYTVLTNEAALRVAGDLAGTNYTDSATNSIPGKIAQAVSNHSASASAHTNLTTLSVDTLKLNTGYSSTGTEPLGTVYWDEPSHTAVIVYPNGQQMNIGEESVVAVQNDTGATITNGMIVMYAGSIGNSGNIRVRPAVVTAGLDVHYIIGMATTDIPNGEVGKVTRVGKVRGIPTNGSKVGETWVNTTHIYVTTNPAYAGYGTSVEPEAPFPAIRIAMVIAASANNGTLYVILQYPCRITDLTDVDGTPLTTTGQILIWDQTRGVFDFNYNFITGTNILRQAITNEAALRAAGDSSSTGYVNSATNTLWASTTNLVNGYFKLDQTNPQVVTGGTPIFSNGVSAVGSSTYIAAPTDNGSYYTANSEAYMYGQISVYARSFRVVGGTTYYSERGLLLSTSGGPGSFYYLFAVFNAVAGADGYVVEFIDDGNTHYAVGSAAGTVTDSFYGQTPGYTYTTGVFTPSNIGVETPAGSFTGNVLINGTNVMTELGSKVPTNDVRYLAAITNGQSGVSLGATTTTTHTVTGAMSMGSFSTTGNSSISANLTVVGLFQTWNNMRFLNKAGGDYLTWATRNTSGAEAVYDLTNLGNITATNTVTASDFVLYETIGTTGVVNMVPSIYLNMVNASTTVVVNADQTVYKTTASTAGTLLSMNVAGLDVTNREANWKWKINFTTTNALTPTFGAMFDWDGFTPDFTVTGEYVFACNYSQDTGGKIKIKQTYPTVYNWEEVPVQLDTGVYTLSVNNRNSISTLLSASVRTNVLYFKTSGSKYIIVETSLHSSAATLPIDTVAISSALIHGQIQSKVGSALTPFARRNYWAGGTYKALTVRLGWGGSYAISDYTANSYPNDSILIGFRAVETNTVGSVSFFNTRTRFMNESERLAFDAGWRP